MVASVESMTIEEMKDLAELAAVVHATMTQLAGKPIDTPAAEKALAEGRADDGMRIIGLPSAREFFSRYPPSMAMGRAYMAECCKRWLALLEPSGRGAQTPALRAQNQTPTPEAT